MRPFLFLALMVLAGCATNFDPAPLPTNHPANPQAQEAPRRAIQRLIGTDAITRKTTAQLARTDAPTPDFEGGGMSHDMSSMGGTAKPSPGPQTGAAYWTCVMHPEIHSDKPGQCPKCGMTLMKKEGATK